jgi:hypothetical protein
MGMRGHLPRLALAAKRSRAWWRERRASSRLTQREMHAVAAEELLVAST